MSKLPQGRKPITDEELAALTRRPVGTVIDYKELYEAAVRDAKEAEAYAEELEKRRDVILKERDEAVERLIKQQGKNQ